MTTTIQSSTLTTPVDFVKQHSMRSDANTSSVIPHATMPQQPHASSQHISHASAHSSQQSAISAFVAFARVRLAEYPCTIAATAEAGSSSTTSNETKEN